MNAFGSAGMRHSSAPPILYDRMRVSLLIFPNAESFLPLFIQAAH